MTATDRLLSFAEPEPNSGCWLWTGAKGSRARGGYPVFWFRGRQAYAHRVAYELLRAPIPRGLVLDHLCRVVICVNPAHLEPVSIRENIRRGRAVDYVARRRSRCRHGHELSGANVKIIRRRDRGSISERRCRQCDIDRLRRRRAGLF